MGPEFLSAIQAKTALETPQILLDWTYDSPASDFCATVPYLWDQIVLRKSAYRYPEDVTDGDAVTSINYATDAVDYYADTNLVGLKQYFYSLFFQYTEPCSSPIVLDQDIARLGSEITAVYPAEMNILTQAADGSTTAGVATIDSPLSTFVTDGVQPGCIVEIADGGADDGFYTVVSVNSETQMTINVALTVTSATVDFVVYDSYRRFWVAGFDFDRQQTIWLWNSHTQLVDQRLLLGNLLSLDEKIRAIPFIGLIAGTRYASIITDAQYIRFEAGTDLREEVASTDVVVDWTLSGVIGNNHEAVGAYWDGAGDLYILDNTNLEITVITELTGTATVTNDISGLPLYDNTTVGLHVSGVNTYVGSQNYIMEFPTATASPTAADITGVSFSRYAITGDFALYTDLSAVTYLVFADGDHRLLQTYTPEVHRAYLWQQPFVPDADTFALYHLDTTSPVDATPNAYTGTNNGMTVEEDARFSYGYLSDAVTDNVDISVAAASWSAAAGTIEFWFQATDGDDLTSGTHIMFESFVDANNYVRVSIDAGVLTFAHTAGGVLVTVAGAHPFPDTDAHYYMLSWSVALDTITAYVDNTVVGTNNGLGVWAGVPATIFIGHGTQAALGVYDEVRLSSIARSHTGVVQSYTTANKAHAYSGRDYTETYEEGDPLGFFYRDQVFTPRFFGGEFLIRNDYEKSQLHPPSKVIAENGEVVYRGPSPLPKLGDGGRMMRMFGLFMDRLADSRECATAHLYDPYNVDVESIPHIVSSKGWLGFDNENWNVDLQRRYLRIMPWIHRRGGRSVSFEAYAQLLGFFLYANHLYARRRLDSVHYNATYDSRVPAVYLDTMGSLDTADQYFPLCLLRYRFYTRSVKSHTGATSVLPASRLLTDAAGSFTTTAKKGSMIRIMDNLSNGDNGDYFVVQVNSDTEILINQDWPAGNLSGLTYAINWEVPYPDPHIDYLLTRFRDIACDGMRVMHLDGTL
jgi:hypothetical protein